MKKNIESYIAILLGIIVCNNVIYAFKINNTYINIAFIASIIIFLYLIIFRHKKLFESIRNINIYFKIFIIICFLSIVPMIIFCDNKSFYTSYITGIVYLIVTLTIYINVYFLKSEKEYIYKGLLYGFLLNVILSLIQYITYLVGNCFSLFEFFPQDAFQVCNINLKNAMTMYIASYRAQGFFLETSYYMIFLASTIMLYRARTKNNFRNLLVILIALFCMINSTTATMVLVFMAMILYFIINKIKVPKEKKKKIVTGYKILGICSCFLALLIMLLVSDKFTQYFNVEEMWNKISTSMLTADINNEDNEERSQAMDKGIKLALKYPFGGGYNLMTKLMMEEYNGEMRVYTTFNYFITLCIEIGIVGALIFTVYIISLTIKLTIKNKDKKKIAIGISALVTFIGQVACGTNFILLPFIILIYALADLESREKNEKS